MVAQLMMMLLVIFSMTALFLIWVFQSLRHAGTTKTSSRLMLVGLADAGGIGCVSVLDAILCRLLNRDVRSWKSVHGRLGRFLVLLDSGSASWRYSAVWS